MFFPVFFSFFSWSTSSTFSPLTRNQSTEESNKNTRMPRSNLPNQFIALAGAGQPAAMPLNDDEADATVAPSALAQEDPRIKQTLTSEASQAHDRLDDARASWEMMGDLIGDVGQYVIRQRIRMAKAAAAKKRALDDDEANDGDKTNNDAKKSALERADVAKAQPPHRKKARLTSATATDEDKSNRAKAATPTQGPSSTSTSSADAERIKRMAAIYVHLRKTHALFLCEIDSTLAEVAYNEAEEESEQVDQETKERASITAAPVE